MEITTEQVVQALNVRAQSDPLIKEIMRSTVYEIIVNLQEEAAKQAQVPEQVEG